MAQGDGLGSLQMLDALVGLLEVQAADSVEEFTCLVVRTEVGIALIERACLFEVAQAEKTIGLVKDGLDVVGVDGDGELATLYRITNVVVHVLR